MWWLKVLSLVAVPAVVSAQVSTDSLRDVDAPQSGYVPNHPMDPSLVASSLAVSWKSTYNTNEQFYAKPLVFTPSGAPNEYVILASSQNNLRVINGVTGALVTQRTLDPPFASSDSNCGDIPNTVGITGTPVIDAATGIMYFFSKGYKNQQAGPQGTINGQYKFYAVQLPGLTDVAGFPVSLEYHNANNDPTRYFIGGTLLQRPSLAMIGNTIVAGFGGHCDNFNYTGYLVSMSKTAGVGVTNIQGMVVTPGAPSPQTLDITLQGGGKAGIWMGGFGLASDANRVFFVTGNARGAGANAGANGKAASGKTYLSTLEQAACNFAVDPNTGKLTQSDYFEPYGYDSNNGGDRDFGSSGLALLDPTVFYGTGANAAVTQIAIAGGKDGTLYVMDANNLGGFAGGNAGADKVLQTIITSGLSFLSGPGSYPLEGGYIYFNPSGDSLYAYQFSRDGNGKPVFTKAGVSAKTYVGKSAPTVTTNNGQAGSGIVWLADVNVGLVAFKAVPVNGVLVQITLPAGAATGGISKFMRPVFGKGRIYIAKQNFVLSLSGAAGQVQQPPMTCTPNPVAFGSVNTGLTSTITVSCTANTAITVTKKTTTNPIWSGASTATQNVASGAKFTFPVTLNLTSAATQAYEDQGYGTVSPGAVGGNIVVYATAGTGFLPDVTIPLSGTVVASGGYLVASLTSFDFGGVTVGGSGSTKSLTLTNKGSQTLSFTGFAWQDFYANGQPYNNVTVQTTSIVGNSYSATKFPAVNSQIAAGASITIPLLFNPQTAQIFTSYLTFWSNGGYVDIMMKGTAQAASSQTTTAKPTTSSKPATSAKVSSSSVKPGTTTAKPVSSTTVVVTPSGTLNPAEPKQIGTWGYIGCYTDNVNNVRTLPSLTEANANMTLEMCSAFCKGYNYFGTTYATQCYCGYTLNSTLRAVESSCTSTCGGNSSEICGTNNRLSTYQNSVYTTPPAAPVHVQSTGGYVWQGCYTEATTGRALSSKTTTVTTMNVENCAAFCAGYTYFGIEYHDQCYCGNTLGAGSVLTATSNCNDLCTGNSLEYCGGASKLDMYLYKPNAVSSTKSASSTSTKASTSASSVATHKCTPSTVPAASTKTFTWSIGWVRVAPDVAAPGGATPRSMIGINGVWPNPTLSVNIGDTVQVTVTNNLGNETTAIHWHGLFQRNTTFADGPAMVTQCPIQPGGTFVYTFTVNQPGTYWYHAHIGGQYIDGLRGPLVVHDAKAPYCADAEIVMTLSDLYHTQAPSLINFYQSPTNTDNNNGAEPVPDAILINEAQDLKFTIVPGNTYLIRIINMGAFAPQYFQIDGHNMTVVEIDGVYTKPTTVTQLFITAAQRYSVLITAKTTNAQNYIVRASMYQNMFNPAVIPADINPDVSAWLIYNPAATIPGRSTYTLTPVPFDDGLFAPYDGQAALTATLTFDLTVSFGPNDADQYRGYLNGITYVPPKVPTLYTALSAPADQVNNPDIYGQGVNPIVLPYGAVVEVTIDNHDDAAHPFHLHGHNFQVIDRSGLGTMFPSSGPYSTPMRRDTIQVQSQGYAVIRFVADNPGISLFHCHIEWHVEAGLTATFIEAPTQLQAMKLTIPASHKSVCAAQGIATTGNAAGNTTDYTSTIGDPTTPDPNPWGALVNKPTASQTNNLRLRRN